LIFSLIQPSLQVQLILSVVDVDGKFNKFNWLWHSTVQLPLESVVQLEHGLEQE